MEQTQARQEFARLLAAAGQAPGDERLRAARLWLAARGAAALPPDTAASPSLAVLLRQVATAPPNPARRIFAVLVVDALASPGLLAGTAPAARLDRAVCSLLEAALADVLRRARYPFDGDFDARRRALAALPANLDECLQPWEPTFPPWLNGLRQR
jgi:hypothetical protein